MDEAFIQDLQRIDWFGACGQPVSRVQPFHIMPTGSWPEAIAHCSDQAWEDATLQASNRLSAFLHHHHHRDYQQWNALAAAAKTRIVAPLAATRWRPFAEANGLDEVLVDCVSWDVLGAAMEHAYRHCDGRPAFFLPLLQVYRAGHFPCGWSGQWPDGQLLAW